MRTTCKEMEPAIGHIVNVQFDKWIVKMEISDVKSVYGRLLFEVTPVNGSNYGWITIDRIIVDTSTKIQRRQP